MLVLKGFWQEVNLLSQACLTRI